MPLTFLMSLDSITKQILTLAGTFNIWIVLAIFIMLVLGEFGTSIPYVMETIWIVAGYRAATGVLTVPEMLVLWLVAVTARCIGAVALYHLAGLGRGPIMRLYYRLFGSLLRSNPQQKSNSLLSRTLRRINLLSPYSVAFGRLIWLRVPLTLILSMRKQLKTEVQAVVLFSAIWDTTYILIGVIGGNVQVKPANIILYSLGGLTVIYVVSFIVQRIIAWRLSKR